MFRRSKGRTDGLHPWGLTSPGVKFRPYGEVKKGLGNLLRFVSCEAFLKLTAHQGDQIGRIFARWAILYFGQLFETCLICPNFCATIFHGKSNALFSANNQLGHNLGDFFTNSSGHPAVQCQYLRSRNNNDPLLKKRPAH
jgi:hypothetical protein